MSARPVYRLTTAERAEVKEAIRSILIDLARARRTITYTELCLLIPRVRLHPHSFVFTALLREVCSEEEAAGHGMLCALVVSKLTGMPGAGYFRSATFSDRDISDPEASWRADLEAVFAYWANR